MMRVLYSLSWLILLPLAFLRLWIRGRQLPAYRKHWMERLAFIHPPAWTERPVWFHMVSLGEARAAIPLIRAFQEHCPQIPLVLTTTTITGRQAIEQAFAQEPLCFSTYLPYDTPNIISRFLKRIDPQKCIILETELWPNLLHQLHQRKIPTFIVNARLSPHSFPHYRWLRHWLKPLLAPVTILAQSAVDQQRFSELGATHTQLIGNIKYDILPPPNLPTHIAHLKKILGERPVWAAASTHEGEEVLLLQAHRLIQEKIPDALLLLIPRHPERFERVAALCTHSGFQIARRSEQANTLLGASYSIFLGDTLGEMLCFLGCAQAAFVGGSLVPIGGHNTLEPALLSLPICVGPHTDHFQEITKLLETAGGLKKITTAESLATLMIGWLSNPIEAKMVGIRAFSVIEKNRGVLDKIRQQIMA